MKGAQLLLVEFQRCHIFSPSYSPHRSIEFNLKSFSSSSLSSPCSCHSKIAFSQTQHTHFARAEISKTHRQKLIIVPFVVCANNIERPGEEIFNKILKSYIMLFMTLRLHSALLRESIRVRESLGEAGKANKMKIWEKPTQLVVVCLQRLVYFPARAMLCRRSKARKSALPENEREMIH